MQFEDSALIASSRLTDNFSRRFTYLRLSITEKCNFRCSYCLPDGSECFSHAGELSVLEIERLVRAFALMGVRKLRITGGEPSLRRDLCEIISRCKALPGIATVALTTNGFRLEKDVQAWRAAGLDALNVSVDSLRPEAFRLITGSDKLASIQRGLELAQTLDFRAIKINSVLLREQNGAELDDFLAFIKQRALSIRFIELMRTGDNQDFFAREHLRGEQIQQRLLNSGWTPRHKSPDAGPATEFTHPDYLGSVGLIMPYSSNFCADCNRLRVSSRGDLYLCLFAEQHDSLRAQLQSDDSSALVQRLQALLSQKTEGHLLSQNRVGSTRNLAMIGG